MQIIFIVVLLKVISAQINELPIERALRAFMPKRSSPQCQRKPTDTPAQCCIIPDLFDEKTNAGCLRLDNKPAQGPAIIGSPEVSRSDDEAGRWALAFHDGISYHSRICTCEKHDQCTEKKCVLRNNDLLFDNDEIDKVSFKQYLNEWVAKRREWMPAVNAAKNICLGNKPLFGFDQMCDADRVLWCINSNLYNKCPDWLDTDSCATTRAYMEKCLPYFDKDTPE